MSLITEVDILEESKECFLTYAREVLTDRAIPSAEDGLLSVQRKILWTAEELLKMNNSSKFKKSASLVGSTLASAYFHGDTSCYGALCKMAQEYLMRYPLIEGDGSLGTQEANGMQAAARYTNARPSKYADLMMNDFKKNVVPLVETYNNEYMEPVVLPSLFPNALVNGREAIGISMSHNSLPMCLTEVCEGIIAYIKNNDITVKELMEYIKGPDFPLGGTVINKKDIYDAFATGHSKVSLKVRGDYVIEDNKIIFTSIPYRTYRNKIKEQINDNVEELGNIIDDFDDESSVGNNRLIFYIKDTASVKTALNKLFALTDLQTSLSYNMNFIVNGTPKLCSLKDLVQAYVEHQIDVILRATEYDKEKAEARAHVLRGLIVAIDKINEVIEMIKASSGKTEAKEKLTKFLNIDSIQAEAILEMKLAKLTKIDKQELVDELKEKEAIIVECNKIINDKDYRDKVLIKKVQELSNKYGDERRTILTDLVVPKEDKEIEYVEPEKCVVIMTESGLIKRIPSSSFKTQKRNGKGIKTQDDITNAIIRTNTIDSLMIFSNKGKMYRLLVDEIPVGTNASKGTSVKALVEMGPDEMPSTIYSIYRDTEAKYVLFATKNGLVKKTSLEEYSKTKKNGLAAIAIREGDELASVTLVKDEPVVLVSKSGMAIKINSTDIGATGRVSMGVKGITLKDGDEVIALLPVHNPASKLALFSVIGTGKKISLSELPIQNRGGKGLMCNKSGKDIAASCLTIDENDILIMGDTNSICISASEIPETTRGAIGNQMIKGCKIISVSKV